MCSSEAGGRLMSATYSFSNIKAEYFYFSVTDTSIVIKEPDSKIGAIMSMFPGLLILGEGLKFTALCGVFPTSHKEIFHITKPP